LADRLRAAAASSFSLGLSMVLIAIGGAVIYARVCCLGASGTPPSAVGVRASDLGRQ